MRPGKVMEMTKISKRLGLSIKTFLKSLSSQQPEKSCQLICHISEPKALKKS